MGPDKDEGNDEITPGTPVRYTPSTSLSPLPIRQQNLPQNSRYYQGENVGSPGWSSSRSPPKREYASTGSGQYGQEKGPPPGWVDIFFSSPNIDGDPRTLPGMKPPPWDNGEPYGGSYKKEQKQEYTGPPPPPPSSETNVVDIVVPIVSSILIIILALVAFRCYRRKKAVVKRSLARFLPLRQKQDSNSSSNYQVGLVDHDLKSHAQTQLQKISIKPANVILTDTVLGRGECGLVTKGFANGLLGYPDNTPVAVKTLIRPEDRKQRDGFLAEIETMMLVGRHLNILNLLGTVIEGNPMIILEYCVNGSLKRLLKKQRVEHFYNHIDKEGCLLPYEETRFQEIERAVLVHHLDLKMSGSTKDYALLSTRDLISFAYQISRGLEYLESSCIIHRDIAARNVLVTEKNIVKISDFGLAKFSASGEFTTQQNFETPMPVKWMAPESVMKRQFSHKSDVWSFGILTCELFSLGDDPYPALIVQDKVGQFMGKVSNGLRMERPLFQPVEMYDKITIKCWELEPKARPRFSELRSFLESFIPLSHQREYLEMGQEHELYNQTYGITPNNAYVDINYDQLAMKY